MNATSVFVCAAAAAVVGWIARRLWVEEREHWLRRQLARRAFLNRPRAVIFRVGTVDVSADGLPIVDGWGFALTPGVQRLAAAHDGERVHDLIAGWTVEELREIASRPDEFSLAPLPE